MMHKILFKIFILLKILNKMSSPIEKDIEFSQFLRNCSLDRYERQNFVKTISVEEIDKKLREMSICDADVSDNDGNSILHHLIIKRESICNYDIYNIHISYVLTYVNPANVNGQNIYGETPMFIAAKLYSVAEITLLIHLFGDRTIKSHSYLDLGKTPLDIAIEHDNKIMVTRLKNCYPSEEQKLLSLLKCKTDVDKVFKDNGYPRFKQIEIDLIYNSLSRAILAVKIGDLDILLETIPHVDVRMTVSLTLIAIENEQNHLLSVLLQKLVRENPFQLRNYESFEPLLYIGLDPSFHQVIDVVSRSRVLCLFKILYHKFIFLDVNSIFDLVQILMIE